MLLDRMAEIPDLMKSVLTELRDGVTIVDANLHDFPLIYVNPAFEQLTGYQCEEVVNKNCRFLQADDRDQQGVALIHNALTKGISCVARLRNYKKTGEQFWNELSISPIHDESGALVYFIGIQKDISNQVALQNSVENKVSELKEVRNRLTLMSKTDPLTSLHNKRYFDIKYPVLLNLARRNNISVSLYMVDVDHFKAYNDEYGHVAGDECLKKVGIALNSFFKRSSDFVARFGGEEFVMLSIGLDENQALKTAKKLNEVIANLKIEHEKSETHYVTVSIGYTYIKLLTSVPRLNPNDIIEFSDQALYLAKEKGRNIMVKSTIDEKKYF